MAGFDDFVVDDDQVDFSQYVMEPEDKSRFVQPYDVMQEICELSFGRRSHVGLTLPWEAYHDRVRFQPGKWTIWGGYTHHGKTHVLKQCMAYAIKCGQKVAIASFEETPGETMFDICCMVLQQRNPDQESIDVFCNWAKGKIWCFRQKRMITPERFIGVMNYAAKELGADHVVGDSLMRMDLDLEDHNATRVFGNALGLNAERSNVHLHLVCHQRKGDETKPGNLYEIKGATYLIDQADKVITVWRNKVPRGERIPDKHIRQDAVLTIDKQRGRPNWIGKIGLNYHYHSTQLIPADDGAKPVEYIRGFSDNRTPELF